MNNREGGIRKVCLNISMDSDNKQSSLKLIFSFVSVWLILSSFVNNDDSYYSLLFIFLINNVIDMIFKKNEESHVVFRIWELINQWVGIIATSLAFCLLIPDFAKVWSQSGNVLDYGLLAVVLSYIIEETLVQFAQSGEEKLGGNRRTELIDREED